MRTRRNPDRALFDLLSLALGTAPCGAASLIFFILTTSEISRYINPDTAGHNQQSNLALSICLFAMFAGPTLMLIERWPQQLLWTYWACRGADPPAPQGTQIFRAGPHRERLCIRLPHEGWFSAIGLLTALIWPMLFLAALLDWLGSPGWVQLALPTALLLGLYYRHYRRYRERLGMGYFDLIIDRGERVLHVPAIDRRSPPTRLPFTVAMGLSVVRFFDGAAESTSLVYYVDINRSESPDLRFVQFNDRADAEHLVQILRAQTGLPDLSPPAASLNEPAGGVGSAAAPAPTSAPTSASAGRVPPLRPH